MTKKQIQHTFPLPTHINVSVAHPLVFASTFPLPTLKGVFWVKISENNRDINNECNSAVFRFRATFPLMYTCITMPVGLSPLVSRGRATLKTTLLGPVKTRSFVYLGNGSIGVNVGASIHINLYPGIGAGEPVSLPPV